jgi:hypothetical protein
MLFDVRTASTNDVNFAYIIDNSNPRGIFTSLISILRNYNDELCTDNLHFYIIDPFSDQRLNFTEIYEQIDALAQPRRFSNWDITNVPSLSKLAEIGHDVGDNIEDLKYFLSLLLDSFEVSRVIFLSGNTVVINDIGKLWKASEASVQCILSTNGDYPTETESVMQQRYITGCMVANLNLMRERNFFQELRDMKTPNQTFDETFYQYKKKIGKPRHNLWIIYDALVPSLPSKEQYLSFVDDDPDTFTIIDCKIAQFSKLTVLNYGPNTNPYYYDVNGMKLEGSSIGSYKCPFPKWTMQKYYDYYMKVESLEYIVEPEPPAEPDPPVVEPEPPVEEEEPPVVEPEPPAEPEPPVVEPEPPAEPDPPVVEPDLPVEEEEPPVVEPEPGPTPSRPAFTGNFRCNLYLGIGKRKSRC